MTLICVITNNTFYIGLSACDPWCIITLQAWVPKNGISWCCSISARLFLRSGLRCLKKQTLKSWPSKTGIKISLPPCFLLKLLISMTQWIRTLREISVSSECYSWQVNEMNTIQLELASPLRLLSVPISSCSACSISGYRNTRVNPYSRMQMQYAVTNIAALVVKGLFLKLLL